MIRLRYMNDTRITSRQEIILQYLIDNKEGSRSQISSVLRDLDNKSRITVIRDINNLISKGFVSSKGKGRSVKYYLTPAGRVFAPLNLNLYFEKEIDERSVCYPQFNLKVFELITNPLDKVKVELFEKGRVKFKKVLNDLDETRIKKELERFIIELSWKSSQIEGNTYSLLETENLIKTGERSKNHTELEALMILNHKKVFDNILSNSEKYKDISIHDVRTIHSFLVEGMNVDKNIREAPVGITGTRYRPLSNRYQVENALENMQEVLSKISNIPEKALMLLALISYIQPFADGNKRTSRMVSNAILLANGYYPLSYRSIDEVEFKKAIVLFYEQNNLYHLKRIFVQQQKFAIDNYFF